MGSAIEWTDETWNPVTGCSRVSPGCDNCYMFAMYPRLRAMGARGYADAPDRVRLLPERLAVSMRWKKPRLVFVNSMSDMFHPSVPFDFVSDTFFAMNGAAEKRGHVFQVLTKRPGRAVAWWRAQRHLFPDGWHPNIWMGTSVENQKYAPRLTVLERLPAPVRFVSAEPLLGPLDLTEWLERDAVQWVIVGGESGPRARPMELNWARELRDQCGEAGVKFFLKQLGGARNKRGGEQALIDGELWRQMPDVPSGAISDGKE